ncbi:glycoside hydrolase family 16 protein [Cercospora zeae-maydis SCOH1-5]|uniref:Glycoside hydrolase family 16 protein n=1 Tax=Cercospora zeae-maydis SCOH1-5 TaxID=717836 RepID=A0A6A6F5S4_9PEZI|nr:glycoside hydrolase family 16 protein [Cercospora zeae-maydis SCOH1-5]
MGTTLVALLLLRLAVAIRALSYVLQTKLSGPTFFDAFDFWTQYDPTFGFVEYIDRGAAEVLHMLHVTDGVAFFGADAVQTYDPSASKGRKSLRLSTTQTFNQPSSVCGIWPAMWMLGNGPLPWPAYGELDIIEYTNDASHALFAMHTAPNCTVAASGQTGTLLTNDCGEDQGYKGCTISPNMPNTFFPRNAVIPPAVLALNPNPEEFGIPVANFEGSCSIDEHFSNMQLIFNIDFCGTWAGPTFNSNTSCPVLDPANQWKSCNIYVGSRPQAFKEAYFAVKSILIYQSAPAPGQSSSVSPPPPPPSSTPPPVHTSPVAASTQIIVRTSTVVVTASAPHQSPLI